MVVARALLPLLPAALLGWPLAAPAATVTVDQVTFEQEAEAAGTSLQLTGAGVFRWKWLFKVYAVALYAPAGVTRHDPAADQPRRLEFSYLVAIGREGFGQAADALLARSLPVEALAPLRDRLERLHAAYVDVKPGDRYALTYLPGQGTELTHNGRRLAVIEGVDFARAYFSIWLGEAPIDAGLRDRLLGR